MILTWRKRIVMVVGLAAVAVALLFGQARPGRSAEPQQAKNAPHRYFGSNECAACHAVSEKNPTRYTYVKGFVYLDEFTRWVTQDKHKLAYNKLSSPRGLKMADLLRVSVTDPNAGCLGCHSASKNETTSRRQGDLYDPNEGVSCENCHGPYSDWDQPHRSVDFRKLDTAGREALGMIDVRVPEIQANQCLSCHIGNHQEGKVVTHDMYAAGHPPLPSIEVASFTDFIPRHWKLVAEKQKQDVPDLPLLPPGQLEQTKLAIVGAAVALKTSMRLLAEEAGSTVASKVPGLGWTDYARFDCWSCHHDLKRDGWRQERGYPIAAPGRVPVSEWPIALVELGIDFLNDPVLLSDLKTRRDAIHAEANTRPFGRKGPIAGAAKELADWTETVLIPKLTALTFDQPAALKLLGKLVDQAQKSTIDYDSARHVGWMIRLLVHELGDTLKNREAIAKVVDKLDAGLKLKLPSGQDFEIENQFGKALEAINDYDPGQFRQQIKELAGLL